MKPASRDIESPVQAEDPTPGKPDSAATPTADLEKLKRYFAECAFKTQDARRNSLIALDYYDSDQYTPQERAALTKRRQPPIVVNRIKPAVNGIIGVIERGHTEPRAWPRNPDGTDAADVATDILRYIADFNRFKHVKRDCFLDMLVPGTCAALMGVDGDRNVTITQVRWEEHFADPQSRRADFKDARYQGIAKWMYADDLTALYPGKADEIESAVQNLGGGMGIGGGLVADESFQDRPLAYSGMVGWVDPKQRRLMVVEMYYREGGWQRCVFTGSDILEEGPSPYLDHKGQPDCPIEALSAYVKRDNSRYGAVWDMIPIQDEINKRRSKALHLLTVSRIEAKDPQAINVDAEEARLEAARPDGVLPYGWGMSPNTAEFTGNVELLTEAKAEMERMAPNPAVLGRDGQDASGRALLARQQAGLVELATLFGALEDFELRIYRQCWARAKQYWTAPQYIRVTDDEDAPRFVGLNQPVQGPMGVGVHPATGLPALMPSVLGYKNAVAEMDVDIEVSTQIEAGTIAQEQFSQLMQMMGANPAWQQQIPLTAMIGLSSIPHKRSVLDAIKQAQQQAQQASAQAQQLQAAHAQAKIDETRASALQKTAQGQASMINALTEAHAMHADHAAAGFAAGVAQQQHEANMSQQRIQAAATEAADTSNGGPPLAPQPQ